MLATLSFKTPDVLDQLPECISLEDSEDCYGCEVCELKEFVKSRIRWSECIDIQFDSEAKTATVI